MDSDLLYLTEKSSQVDKLKKALKAEFGDSYKCTVKNLVGHVMRSLEAKEYEDGIKNWSKMYNDGRLPYVPKEWKKVVSSDKKVPYNNAIAAIKKAKKIILATDPDNEGVVLGMEVIESVKCENKVVGMINMNKLDETSLRKEVRITNKINYKNMNSSGNARGNGDWIYGMSGTTAASVILGSALTGGKSLIRVGGVKSIIMGMVVERDNQFENFKNIPFWQIKGIVEKDGKEFEVDFLYNNKDRFDKEDIANEILKNLSKEGEISKYSSLVKKTEPKKPLSLGNLQSIAETKYNLKGDKVLPIAQSLYDKTYQSYPRTDNNYYADGEYKDVPSIISNLEKANKIFANLISKMKTPYLKRKIFDDKKITAHSALAPTSTFPSNITDVEEKIYKITVGRYLEQFLPDYEYLGISGEGKTSNKDLIFKFKNNVTKSLGWKEVEIELFNAKDDNKERKIPDMKVGDKITFKKLWLHKGETKPKPRFTYKTLKEALDKIENLYDDPIIKKNLKGSGIGTPATRDNILTEMFEGKILEYEKKKYIKSTENTRIIVDLLPNEMTSPIFRAEFESKLKEVETGSLTQKQVEDYMVDRVKHFMKEMESIAKSKNIVQGGFGGGKVETLLKCPICKEKLMKTGKSFVCSKRKWDPKTKKSSGCSFGFIIEQKPISKKISEEEMEKLINGEVLTGSNGNKLSLDLNSKPFFSKVEWASSGNTNVETSLKCPICSNGKVLDAGKVFKCSTAKWDPKTKKTSGCNFVLFKDQKKFLKKELKLKDVEQLIKGEGVKGGDIKDSKTNKIKNNVLFLDKTSKFFTKIEWGK